MSESEHLIINDDKKSELKVKIDFLKHNVFEITRELEKIGSFHKDVSAKYQAAKEIEELRDYQSNTLFEEVKTSNYKKDQLTRTIHLLKQEKFELERENSFIDREIKEQTRFKETILNYSEELTSKRKLLEKEVKILKERYTGQDKNKLNNEVLNTTSQKQYDRINIELSENNLKIISLQNKIDEILIDINKYENLLSNENYEKYHQEELNDALEKKLFTARENLKITENKFLALKREIENVKENVNEAESERTELNSKIERLIEIFSNLNQTNLKINTLMNFVYDSFKKKTQFMESEADFIVIYSEMRKKILILLKEINSYKDTIQNFY